MLNRHSSHLIHLFLNGAKQTLGVLDAMVTFQDGADLVLEMQRSPTNTQNTQRQWRQRRETLGTRLQKPLKERL